MKTYAQTLSFWPTQILTVTYIHIFKKILLQCNVTKTVMFDKKKQYLFYAYAWEKLGTNAQKIFEELREEKMLHAERQFLKCQICSTRRETQTQRCCLIGTILLSANSRGKGETSCRLVEKDPKVSTRMVSEWLDITKSIVHNILTQDPLPFYGFHMNSQT